jgi:hypothetical protein
MYQFVVLFIINTFFSIITIFSYIFRFINNIFLDIDFFIKLMRMDFLNYLKNFLLIILNTNDYFIVYIHLIRICL